MSSTLETDPAADVMLVMEAQAAAASGAARWLRIAAGLSQREMAEAIGRTPAAISLWEAGLRKPGGEAAIRYARLLRALGEQLASGPGKAGRTSTAARSAPSDLRAVLAPRTANGPAEPRAARTKTRPPTTGGSA